MYYLKYFFITSILGFLLESIINGKSGILYGPYTPVYGIGCIIILLIFKQNRKRTISTKVKYIITIIASTILLTLAELIGGLLIEKIFHTSFWDYTNKKYNVGKYICLEISLIWFIGTILFLLIKPILDKIINKIPKKIIYILTIIFIIDMSLTLTNRSKINEKNNNITNNTNTSWMYNKY